MGLNDAIDLLKTSRTLQCNEVKNLLESFGFKVIKTKKGNHYVFKHPSLKEFWGGNYDCGHGKNPEIKKCYLKSIASTLDTYRQELSALNK